MKNTTYFKLLSIISFITFCIIVTLASGVRDMRFNGQSQLFFLLLILFGAVGVWLEVASNKSDSGPGRKREKDAADTQLDT
ncbi:MAG: hypothetical protein AAF708_17065 [Deinococcota bacterium]